MESEIRSEIDDNLSRYLREEIPLQDFEDWFAPVLWEVADSHDEESRSLVGTISNRIAEYSAGYRSEESLRKELENSLLPSVARSPLKSSPFVIHDAHTVSRPASRGTVLREKQE